MKKTLFVFFLLFTCHLSLVTQVKAQSALGLTAIPPRLEIEGDPGQVVTKEIKVRNESLQNRVVYTTIKDFIVSDDSGTPLQLEDTDLETNPDLNRWTASSWIHISPTKLQLKPGETKSLTLTVIVPDNALPGGHYSMILHSPQNEVALDETGAAIQTNVGTLVYITVAGDITENARIEKFTAPKFSEYGPIDIDTTVYNLSDVHISPIGQITIKNWLGGTTQKIVLNPINIFPYTSRDITSTLSRRWLFGRYQAQLEAGYGTQGNLLAATLYFWVIPWRLLLLLIAFVAILFTLVYLLRRQKQLQDQIGDHQIDQLEAELDTLKKKYQDRK